MSLSRGWSNLNRIYSDDDGCDKSINSIMFSSQSLSQHFPQPRRAIKLDSLPLSLSSLPESKASTPSSAQSFEIKQEEEEEEELEEKQHNVEADDIEEQKMKVFKVNEVKLYPYNELSTARSEREEKHEFKKNNKKEEDMKQVCKCEAGPLRVREVNVMNAYHVSSNKTKSMITKSKQSWNDDMQMYSKCGYVTNNDVTYTSNMHHDNLTCYNNNNNNNSNNVVKDDLKRMSYESELTENTGRNSTQVTQNDDNTSINGCNNSNNSNNSGINAHNNRKRLDDEIQIATLRFPFTRALSLSHSSSPLPNYEEVQDKQVHGTHSSEEERKSLHSDADSVYKYASDEIDVSSEGEVIPHDIHHSGNNNNSNSKPNSYITRELNSWEVNRSISPEPRITSDEGGKRESTVIERRRCSCTLSEGLLSTKDESSNVNMESKVQQMDLSFAELNTCTTTSINNNDDNNDKNYNCKDASKEFVNNHRSCNDESESQLNINTKTSVGADVCYTSSTTPPPRRAFLLAANDEDAVESENTTNSKCVIINKSESEKDANESVIFEYANSSISDNNINYSNNNASNHRCIDYMHRELNFTNNPMRNIKCNNAQTTAHETEWANNMYCENLDGIANNDQVREFDQEHQALRTRVQSLLLVNGNTPTPLRTLCKKQKIEEEEHNERFNDTDKIEYKTEHNCDFDSNTSLNDTENIYCSKADNAVEENGSTGSCKLNNTEIVKKNNLLEEVAYNLPQKLTQSTFHVPIANNKSAIAESIENNSLIICSSSVNNERKGNKFVRELSMQSNEVQQPVIIVEANLEDDTSNDTKMSKKVVRQDLFSLTKEPRVSVEVRELVERAETQIRHSRESLLSFSLQQLERSPEHHTLETVEEKEGYHSDYKIAESSLHKREGGNALLEAKFTYLSRKQEYQEEYEEELSSSESALSLHHHKMYSNDKKNFHDHVNLLPEDIQKTAEENLDFWHLSWLRCKVEKEVSKAKAHEWSRKELQHLLLSTADDILSNLKHTDNIKCGVLPMEVILHVLYLTLSHQSEGTTAHQSNDENNSSHNSTLTSYNQTVECKYTENIDNTETTRKNKEELISEHTHIPQLRECCNAEDGIVLKFCTKRLNNNNNNNSQNTCGAISIRARKRSRECEVTCSSPTRTLENALAAQANMSTRKLLDEFYHVLLDVFTSVFGERYALTHLGASNCSSVELITYLYDIVREDRCNELLYKSDNDKYNAKDDFERSELTIKLFRKFPRLCEPYEIEKGYTYRSNTHIDVNTNTQTNYNINEKDATWRTNNPCKHYYHGENESVTNKFAWPLTYPAHLDLTQPPPLDMMVHYTTFINSLHEL